jgi:hypothetical protein
MLTRLPTLLELYGYTYFIPACTIGPFFEFKDFINFVESKEHYANVPSTLYPGLMKFGEGVICTII